MNFAARVCSFSLSLSPATLSADWKNWEAFILISLYGPNTPIIHLALLTVSTACFPPSRTLLSFYPDVLSPHVGYIGSDKDSLVLLSDWWLENDWRPNSGSYWLLWSAQALRFWTYQGSAVSQIALAPPIFPTLSVKLHRLLSLSSRLKGTTFMARCLF